MGHHAGAMIAYGYDLGDTECGWNVREPFDALPWFDREDDFASALMTRLRAIDFPGVTVELYGWEWGAVFLCAHKVVDLNGCGSETFEPGDLNGVRMVADAKLKRVVEFLGITPTEPAAWHLLVRYG